MPIDPGNVVKCMICGSGPEGLTRHRGKELLSVCEFHGELQCPKCKEFNCVFIHDDVPDGELWKVCGKCDYIAHIGG